MSKRCLVMLGLLMTLAACGGAPAKPPPQAPLAPTAEELERIDVYGSRLLTREEVLERWGARLVEVLRNPGSLTLAAKLGDEIKAREQLAYAYPCFSSYDGKDYVSLDLVDERDRATRMALAPRPTGTFADPDGLIAAWLQYEEKVRALRERGAIDETEQACPYWHCLAPFNHPELATFGELFSRRVPAAEAALAQILVADKDLDHRAAAAYLLAHLASGARVVELLLPAVRDPHELVRNNVMRVLGMIAANHPDIDVPAEPFIQALGFPFALDHNKAAFVLHGILEHRGSPALRQLLHQRTCSQLVDLLELRFPVNRYFAYKILKLLARQDFGEQQIPAWRSFCAAPLTL